MPTRNPIERLADARHEFGEHGGVNMSVEASTTFTVMEPGTMPELFQGRKSAPQGCYLYGRHFNPTVYQLGRQLAAIEGTEAAYCAASGMAAISAAILQLCRSGDHIVASNTIYGGTYALLHDFLPAKANIHTTFVDVTDLEAVIAAVSNRTKVIYAESIANPTLRVADIPALAEIARAANAQLVIDNTFSPLLLSPASLGADVVVHSMTKFINGASDIIAGAICGSMEFVQGLMDLHTGPLMILGPTMDPTIASKISLRIPHLALRVSEHAKRAQIFAERLEAIGVSVVYPGLPAHPDHELLRRHRCAEYGFGGILTLDLGSEEKANQLMDLLQNKYGFGFMAVSLGYFDTLMSCPSSSTSSEMSDDDLSSAGIGQGLVRLSVGYTGTIEQRWGQLESALRSMGVTEVPGAP
ncbi:MAG: aminotransferase class I/II-fold pyridoxal phosphate-dependent enzyme [Woeseiaceae bacterium]|nr:aminotransferase class I/II-fold pyridoxal phosphate-dependent enzyme [Woeseiaceae bacterium]